MKLSHIDKRGAARMVDISGKTPVKRMARASAQITLQPETIKLIRKGLISKGDVLAAARLAGISAAKKTWDLIPLCHNIEIDNVEIDLAITNDGITIESKAVCTDRTGIEMEALTAVSIAALTIYDMCKAVDKHMKIKNIVLIEKKKATSRKRGHKK